jgi:hypothetical protein
MVRQKSPLFIQNSLQTRRNSLKIVNNSLLLGWNFNSPCSLLDPIFNVFLLFKELFYLILRLSFPTAKAVG